MPPETRRSRQTEPAGSYPSNRRRRITALALLWIGFLAAGVPAFFSLLQPGVQASLPPMDVPFPVEPPRRTLVVILDALRADVAADPEAMPGLARLRASATAGHHQPGPFPVSASFYKAFLAGKPATLWDVYNDLSPRPRRLRSWVTDSGMPCYYSGPASGYAWVAEYARADYVWRLDQMENIPEHDRRACEATVERLERTDRGILFCHLAALDAAAHRHGARSTEYRQVVQWLDQALLQFARRLNLQQDLLLVLSDHGVRDDGGHSSAVDPAVRNAPFVACGPMFRPQAGVELDQTSWPLLMAAVIGSPVPAGYAGVPPPELLRGAAAHRLQRLNEKYTDLLVRSLPAKSITAAIRPLSDHAVGETPKSARAILVAAKKEAERAARLTWWLCSLTAVVLVVVTLKLCPLYRSENTGTLAALIVAAAFGWLFVEKVRSGAGQLDGTFLDDLPQLRASEFFRAPWAVLATCALAGATVAVLNQTRVRVVALMGVSLCASVSALQRNRADLLLYGGLAWALVHAFAPRSPAASRRAGALICALFPLAAIGQKLSYDPNHCTGVPWSAAISSAGLAAFAWGAMRRKDRFALAAAAASTVGSIARATQEPWLGITAWCGALLLLVASFVNRVHLAQKLAALAVAVAPLLLPWPQMWTIFFLGLLFYLQPGSERPACARAVGERTSVQWTLACATAVFVCLLLFFYGGGRDAYLPINEFYRTAIGAEADGLQFSMLRAALAVASRFALYVVAGIALTGWLFPTLSTLALIPGLLGFFGVRLAANTLAFALFAERAWNYHLALLFNDAVFLAAVAVIAFWVAPLERRDTANNGQRR